MFRKFGPNDVILNTMRTTPRSHFFLYNSQIYYNNEPSQTFDSITNETPGGPDPTLPTNVTASYQVRTLQAAGKTGFLSLYEYNIARTSGSFDNMYTRNDGTVPMIYPYISKDSARASFKTAVGGNTLHGMTPTFYNNEFAVGDVLTASYPQNCTITREFIEVPSGSPSGDAGAYNAHYMSLVNTFNLYGVRSRHYVVSSSFAQKYNQNLNLIHIPSLFYGTRMLPGTLSLKWYFTGSLIAELRDTKKNGELIQVSGAYPDGDGNTSIGKVAGVALYEEGFLVLTGSWPLFGTTISLSVSSSGGSDPNTANYKSPSWKYWGAGMNDNVTTSNTENTGDTKSLNSASFALTFNGDTSTQVLTLYAHARRGEANYSNNPTFLKFGQREMKFTSSHVYEENPNRLMKNTVSSAYGTGAIASGYTASFKRQVYISKIGVYDRDKNLIGIATLSSPVRKKEEEDLAFKLKMDF